MVSDRRRELDPEPAPGLSARAFRRGSQPVTWMQVTGYQRDGPQNRVGGPAVSVKDSDRAQTKACGGVKPHLAGKGPGKPDVVVSGDDLDRESGGQQGGAEIEHVSPERGRHSHDRLLEVSREDHAPGPGLFRNVYQLLGHFLRPGSRRTWLARVEAAQSQMGVGGDQPAFAGAPRKRDVQDRVARHRSSDRRLHAGADPSWLQEGSGLFPPGVPRISSGRKIVLVYIQPLADSLWS
jgi:hypothetical protein